MQSEPEAKLPPLPNKLDGDHEEVMLEFRKCTHELEVISSTEVRCKKCRAGWLGAQAYLLAL